MVNQMARNFYHFSDSIEKFVAGNCEPSKSTIR